MFRKERVQTPEGFLIIEYHRHVFTLVVNERVLGCSHVHGDGSRCDSIVYAGYNGEGCGSYLYKEVSDGGAGD